LIKLRDGNIVSQAEPTQLYSAVADVVAKFDDMVVAHASPATQLPRCRLYFVPPVPEIVCIDIPNLQFILTKVLLWAASQVVGLRDSASVAVVVSLDSESGRKQIKFEVFDNGMSFGGATVESLLAATSTIPKVTLFTDCFCRSGSDVPCLRHLLRNCRILEPPACPICCRCASSCWMLRLEAWAVSPSPLGTTRFGSSCRSRYPCT
jgi:hypothetical protein